jgi:hypothetical protein
MFITELPKEYYKLNATAESFRKGYILYHPKTLKPFGFHGIGCSDYILDWFSYRYETEGKEDCKELTKQNVFLFSYGAIQGKNLDKHKKFFDTLNKIEALSGIPETHGYLLNGTHVFFVCDSVYIKYSHLTSFILKLYRDHFQSCSESLESLLKNHSKKDLISTGKLLEVAKNDFTYTGWVSPLLENHSNCGIDALRKEKIDIFDCFKQVTANVKENIRYYKTLENESLVLKYLNMEASKEAELKKLKKLIKSKNLKYANTRFATYSELS